MADSGHMECARLVSTFCQFFVDKVNRIRDSIAVELLNILAPIHCQALPRSDAVVVPAGDD